MNHTLDYFMIYHLILLVFIILENCVSVWWKMTISYTILICLLLNRSKTESSWVWTNYYSKLCQWVLSRSYAVHSVLRTEWGREEKRVGSDNIGIFVSNPYIETEGKGIIFHFYSWHTRHCLLTLHRFHSYFYDIIIYRKLLQ